MQSTTSAQQLNEAWLQSFEQARVLSLDCFDTLFWRKVIHPTDVFTALQSTEVYREYRLTARKRTAAEGRVRARNLLLCGCPEVALDEIYQEMGQRLDQKAINALIQAEIKCEIEFGFIFQPIVELIERARRRKMKVVVVSDTYFSAAQLRQLLFGTLPTLEGMIDDVFCSADHRKGKTTGIWPEVLRALAVTPDQVLHLGDNYHADFDSPVDYGITARHLVAFSPEVNSILTQRQMVSSQIFPLGSTPMLAPQYFHGQLSRVQSFDADAFGYASLGPIFQALASYVTAEVAAVEAQGRTVRVAYLLRDGYLPGKACEALAGSPIGSYVNISRFTALAASLDGEDAIIAVLEKVKDIGNYASALRQLLVPEAQANVILKSLEREGPSWPALVRAVTHGSIKSTILERSRRFRQRLLTHVQRLTGLQRGETLMLVDVGYSGTAQLSLHKVFRDNMDVELMGRYLVANDLAYDDLDKRGLIDPSWADPQLIAVLVRYIAALEMMCTQNQPTTLDYEEDGSPIFDKSTTGRVQSERVEHVQQGCLRFIKEFAAQAPALKPTLDAQQLRYSAAVDLIRLLYFPIAAELSCLEGFQFDSNMGTDWQHPLLDIAAGEKALRGQGLGYIETTLEHSRANVPMELRHSNLAFSALVFAHLRYGFNINPSALSLRSEPLQALIVDGDQFTQNTLTATATHDGFYAARIPRSRNFDISVLLGARYHWIQVESLQVLDPRLPANATDLKFGQDVLLEGLHHRGNGIFELDEHGFIYFPRHSDEESGLAYSLVFRPLMVRP